MSNVIRLLKASTGESMLSTWIMVLAENSKFIKKHVLTDPKYSNPRAIEAVLALNHEGIHFWQALSTPIVYKLSKDLVDLSFEVIKIFKAKNFNSTNLTDFRRRFDTLRSVLRKSFEGLSCLDIIEGVAVIEAYKMTYSHKSPGGFIDYLYNYFPNIESKYTKSFRLAKKALGLEVAYELLSSISYLALHGQYPAKTFKTSIDYISSLSASDFIDIELKDLVILLGYDDFLHKRFQCRSEANGSVPDDLFHPILSPYVMLALKRYGARKLIKLSACPHKIYERDVKWLSDIVPPLVVFSTGRGGQVNGVVMGLAKEQPKKNTTSNILTTAIVGAVERILLSVEGEDVSFMPCPHEQCPVHNTKLCHKYFSIPSLAIGGWSSCGFPTFFEVSFGANPKSLWNTLIDQALVQL